MRNELLIGYDSDTTYSLDTIEGLNIPITKNIYSIEDPSKRLSDYTKTVQIPGSKKNDGIFKSLFDVNFHIRDSQQLNPDFNPAKKAYCAYIQDQHIQIEGYCQLTDIIVLNENKVIYQIVIYGQNADIFSQIGDKLLTDITGFGTFDWVDADIKATWTSPTGVVYYPYVDRGQAFSWRQGVAVPHASVDYNMFKPWISIYFTFMQILDGIGIGGSQLESTFLSSDMFRSLYMECDMSKFTLDETKMANSKTEANRVTTQSITFSSLSPATIYANQKLIPDVVVSDNLAQYDNSTGTITILNEGNHTITGSRGVNSFTSGNTYREFAFCTILKRGTNYQILESKITSGVAIQTSGVTPQDGEFKLENFYFLSGDEVRTCLWYVKDNSFGFPFGDVVRYDNSLSNPFLSWSCYETCVAYGDTVYIKNIIYPMKQTEFFMGIVKMFNLYIERLPNGKLLIEPREDFFTEDTTDWTDKLDTSKDFKITPEGLLVNKEIDFNYFLNEDDVSKAFNQSTGQVFGYKRLIFTNDFVKEIKKVDIPFVCEPLQNNDLGMVLIKTNYAGAALERTTKPMIGFAGGLFDCAPYNYYLSGSMSFTTYSQYAYIGFLNDPLNLQSASLQYDLCFGPQDIYFHNTSTGLHVTNQNLYNLYHKTQWEQIGDRDSKLVECYIKLNAYDISTLSFRPIYWIDKAAYRLLEIQDYNPNGTETTLCRFLKLNLVDAFVPSTDSRTGNVNTGGGGGGGHQGGGNGDQMNLNNVLNGVWQGGNDNIIDKTAKGVLITGNGNTVGPNGYNILIKGSNNTILPGLSNVTLINSSNLVINESDVLYIDSVKVEIGTPLDGYIWTYDSAAGAIKMKAPLGPSENYFFYITASDIGTYYKMLTPLPTGGSQNIIVNNCSGTQLIAVFATDPGLPNREYIPVGWFRTHFHAVATGGGKCTMQAEIYKRTAGGTETLLGSTDITAEDIAGSISPYDLTYYNATLYPLSTTDRIVIKFYAIVSSGNPDVGIYFENSYNSRLEIPI